MVAQMDATGLNDALALLDGVALVEVNFMKIKIDQNVFTDSSFFKFGTWNK